jgi:hypothetical protein
MAIQTINIGNVVNDGLGDDLRSAFQKVNGNFAELQQGLTVTASNIGATGFGIFKEKVNNDLQFKNLVPGTKITIDEFGNSLRISTTINESFERFDTQSGVIRAVDFNNISIRGGEETITFVPPGQPSTLVIDTKLPISKLFQSYDFGPITGLFDFNTTFALSAANVDFGPIRFDELGNELISSAFSLDLGDI